MISRVISTVMLSALCVGCSRVHEAGCSESIEEGFCVAPLEFQDMAIGVGIRERAAFQSNGWSEDGYVLTVGYGPRVLANFATIEEAEKVRQFLFVRMLNYKQRDRRVIDRDVLRERVLNTEDGRRLLALCGSVSVGLRYHNGHATSLAKPIVSSYWYAYESDGAGTMVGYFEEGTEKHNEISLLMVNVFSALKDYITAEGEGDVKAKYERVSVLLKRAEKAGKRG